MLRRSCGPPSHAELLIISQSEINGDLRINCHCLSIEEVGAISPLANGVKSETGKHWGPADKLECFHISVLRDNGAEDHCALRVSDDGNTGVYRLHTIDEACGVRMREGDGFVRSSRTYGRRWSIADDGTGSARANHQVVWG